MTLVIALMVGVPGVGKTTFVNAFSDSYKHKYNIYKIHYDCYLTQICPGASYSQKRINIFVNVENLVKSVVSKAATTFQFFDTTIELARNSLPNVIFIDDNMYYRSMRNRFYKLALQYNSTFCQIFLRCDLPIAQTRNKLRVPAQQIPVETINNLFDRLEGPAPEKYPWEKFSIELNTNDCFSSHQPVGDLLEAAIKHPFVKRDVPEVEIVMPPSLIHQIDLCLRRKLNAEISQLLASEGKSDIVSGRISDLVKHKQSLFNQIKSGKIDLNENGHDVSMVEAVEMLFDHYC